MGGETVALVILPKGNWIDIPAKGYGIDYGFGNHATRTFKILESNITGDRVVELLRECDEKKDDASRYIDLDLPNIYQYQGGE